MQRGSKQDEQIKQLIVELRDFGWIVPGIVVDQLEYLLPLLPSRPGLSTCDSMKLSVPTV
jgi:hypothetical protein